MRVRAMQDISPINVMPGDSIQLAWSEDVVVEGLFGRRRLSHSDEVLLSETFTESRVVDRVAIVELDDGELRALGMSQGIAGVFGRAV